MRAPLSRFQPPGPRDLHSYGDVVRCYLRGSTAWKRDVLQGSFGSTSRVDPAVLRRTASVAEMRAEGAEGRMIYPSYPIGVVRHNVYPSSARRVITTRQEMTAPAIEVVELPNALVVNTGGAVRTEDGRWLRDLHPMSTRAFRKALPRMEARAQGPSRRLAGTTAVLMLRNAHNYYHWLHQILPQIDAIQNSRPGLAVDRWLVRELPPFAADILTRFDIDLSTVETIGDEPVVCERLIVGVPPTMGEIDYPGEWPRSLMRGLFLPLETIVPWRRVYLRRGDGDKRPVVNGEALDAFLIDRGFEVCEMSGLSVERQARLFAESSLIVAPHGAALANLVFCAPGAHVVELLPCLWPSPLFGMIAHACGLSHVFVPGVEPCLPALRVRRSSAAMKVSIPHLAHVLRTIEAA